MTKENIRCRCRGRTIVGVVSAERHVTKEVVDVGEELLVGEDILLMGVRDEEVVSSRTERSPKTLSPLSLVQDRKRRGSGGLLSELCCTP
jgi:hypothetical protein